MYTWTNEVVFGSTFCTVIVLVLFRHWAKQKNSYSILNFAGCPIIKWLFTAHQKWHTLKNWIRVALSFIPRHHQQQHNITCAVGERRGVYWMNTTKKKQELDLFSISGLRIFLLLHTHVGWRAGNYDYTLAAFSRDIFSIIKPPVFNEHFTFLQFNFDML